MIASENSTAILNKKLHNKIGWMQVCIQKLKFAVVVKIKS